VYTASKLRSPAQPNLNHIQANKNTEVTNITALNKKKYHIRIIDEIILNL